MNRKMLLAVASLLAAIAMSVANAPGWAMADLLKGEKP
jgi:hypothetical protein